MIEVPVWIFIMLLVGLSLFISVMIFWLVQFIHDKLVDLVKRKTDYNKYKEFLNNHSDSGRKNNG